MLLPKAKSQELLCNVKVNGERVQTQERQVFDEMEKAIQQFLNTTKWTELEVREEEKIKCDILITLERGTSITDFGAQVQIKSMRPVYGSDYDSPLLSFFDRNWKFSYSPSQPLIFSDNVYTSELTSLLAFYAYIIIALDADSFAMQGGTPYIDKAFNILNNAQATGGPGWRGVGGDTRDRYWLMENLNSPQFGDFRSGLYEYHRLGLDILTENPDQVRTDLLQILQRIKEVRDLQPTSVTINSFFDAKAAELANLYAQGDEAIRQQAMELLMQLDPTNSNIYRKILN
jgi:hypothetical protein